jgi:hypothetical protein
MSLILDALRKLERERGANEPPGVLVVGSVPWGETSRARRLALVVGAAAVLGLAVLTGWLLRPVPKAPAPVAASAVPASIESPPPPATTQPALQAAVPPSEPPAPPIRLSRPLPTPLASAPDDAGTASPSGAGPQATPATPLAETPRLAAPGELRLTAISERDGRPVALINDRLVFEGDSFDGVTVIRIGDTDVEVEVKGQRRVLRF